MTTKIKQPKKKTNLAPAPELVARAVQSSAIKQLVWLADAFHRVGARGSVTTQTPLFCAGEIKDKGFRKFNLGIETVLETDSMRVGARDGLIFRFRPKVAIERRSAQGTLDLIEFVEMGWSDVCNVFTSLADDIEGRIKAVRGQTVSVDELDREIRSVIQKNKDMHPIIVQGFTKAQELAKSQTNEDVLEHIPGFGTF